VALQTIDHLSACLELANFDGWQPISLASRQLRTSRAAWSGHNRFSAVDRGIEALLKFQVLKQRFSERKAEAVS